MNERGKVLQKRLLLVKSGVCMKALLSAFLSTQSAFAQERDPAHFGAFGQNVKVGVLVDGTWSGHREFRTRDNLMRFADPFADTNVAGAGAKANPELVTIAKVADALSYKIRVLPKPQADRASYRD
ncbi:hypothetical protein [Agrobacterium sp. V1]|uniref:hypothetical protein n=1 Tax=Agrobacterium sp. V1 TaxID=3061957 RepID=UPI002671DCF3|nr:hypothetical protein [Agrobacterium sp. V1]MDO3445247.1 hypothetical protein [Agrobacterium sp. V1]